MADESMTDGEIRRNFQRIDQAYNAQAQRIADLARDMVPATLWQAEHRAITTQFARHEREADEQAARAERQIQLFKDACDKASADLRKELQESIKAVREERDKRTEFTWTRVLAVLGLVAVLVAALITTYATSKGIK